MTTTPPDQPAHDAGTTTQTGTQTGAQTGTQTLPPPAPDEGPRVGFDDVRDLGRLRRSSGDRRVAGVAGGLARHLDVDPLLLRVGFVVLVFFGGAGLILYLAAWVLVPRDDTGRAGLRLDARSRTIALVAVGVIAALALLGSATGAAGVPWPVVVVGLLVLVVVALRRPRREGDASDPAFTSTASPTTYVAPAPRPYRGPVLFWFVLAAITLGLGVLALLDGAGLAVTAGAYPALALTLTGAGLVLGAFWGRPGGLVALGLVAALTTAGASAADRVDTEPFRVTPTTADGLSPSYSIGAGELVVDLADVRDLDALEGRTLFLDATAGRIEVLVPAGLDVVGEAHVENIGEVDVFDLPASSAATTVIDHDGGSDAPTLTIDATVSFGEIVVRESTRSIR